MTKDNYEPTKFSPSRSSLWDDVLLQIPAQRRRRLHWDDIRNKYFKEVVLILKPRSESGILHHVLSKMRNKEVLERLSRASWSHGCYNWTWWEFFVPGTIITWGKYPWRGICLLVGVITHRWKWKVTYLFCNLHCPIGQKMQGCRNIIC